MRIKLNDKQTYEIGKFDNGEAYVEIPDEEIFDLIVSLCKNERIVKKYEKDLINLFDDEIQDYAEKLFYEQGKGEIIK